MAQQPSRKQPGNRGQKPETARKSAKNDAASSRNAQPASVFDDFFEEQKPEPQIGAGANNDRQRQWISDHLMWETTLGMREDETINRAITPEEKARQLRRRAAPPQAKPKARPAAQRPTAPPKPAASQGRRPADNHELRLELQNQPGSTARRAAPPQPQRTASQAPVPSKNRTAMQRPAPQARQSSGQNRGQTTTPPPQARRPQANPPRAKQALHAPQRPQNHPAEFTGREVDMHIQTQDVGELLLKQRREKITKLALKIVFIISVATGAYIAGYISGKGAGNDELNAQNKATAENAAMAPTEKAQKSAKTKKPVKANKAKAPKRQSQSTKANIATAQQTAPAEETPHFGLAFEEPGLGDDGAQSYVDPYKSTNISPTDDNDLSGNPRNAQSQSETVIDADQTTMEPVAVFDGKTIELSESDTQTSTEQAAQTASPQSSSQSLQSLLDESLQRFQNQEWQTVIELSDKILALDPNATTALTNRAVAHTELGDYEAALQDCNLAININPDDPLAYNNRGYIYEKMQRIQEAVGDYQSACDLGIELSCKEVKRLSEIAPDL
ncbi:tetratricopeptide repeat protein [Kaarinaea lacus]